MEGLIIEDRVPRETFQFTVDAKGGGLPCNQVQVRGPMLDHHTEEFIYLGHRAQPPVLPVVVYGFLLYRQMKLRSWTSL